MNAGIIVDAPLLDVRFRGGRKLGTVEDNFAATLSPGDTFFFAGLVLEVEKIDGTDLIVRATRQIGADPDLSGRAHGDDAPTSPSASATSSGTATQWPRFPDDVREWLEVQD